MNEAILTVLAQVSEQMGFLTPTGPADAVDPAILVIVVGVRFSGPASGQVFIAASSALGEALARNLLAGEAEAAVDPADARDALLELVNVAAGNLLPLLHGAGEYHLGSPEDAVWPAGAQLTAAIDCVEGVLAACVVPTA